MHNRIPQLSLLVCQDADGEWWNWTRGMPERLIAPPGKAATTAEFRQWLAPRLEERAQEFPRTR